MGSDFRYTLEKGSKKHPCPACGKRTAVRYIDVMTLEYLPEQYSRCDRAENCAYHLSPYKADYFKEMKAQGNSLAGPVYSASKSAGYRNSRAGISSAQMTKRPEPELIPGVILEATIKNGYNSCTFIQNLLHRVPFPFDRVDVEKVIALYRLGSVITGYRAGSVTFPFIDERGGIRAIQVKQFDESNHTIGTDWLHSIIAKFHLGRGEQLPPWLERYQKNELKVSCLFGAHLLSKYPSNRIVLVEAPKTAICGTLYFCPPDTREDLLWLAVYSRDTLTVEKCRAIQGRTVYLFPDLSKDGSTFKLWQAKADEIMRALPGTKIVVSNLLEMATRKTDREKGLDLADYLIQLDWRLFRNAKLQERNKVHEPVKQPKPEPVRTQSEDRPEKVYVPPQSFVPGSWTEEINEIDVFFESAVLPDQPLKLNPFTPVGNPKGFLKWNLDVARAQNGNPTYRPYLTRAQLLMEWMKSNIHADDILMKEQLPAESNQYQL